MAPPSIEVCILAGGHSTRMGRDKSRLRLGGRTLLAQVRTLARTAGFPARVLRRDLVPGCGPVGGVCTALETTGADFVLFLSCDMPFVTTDTLRELIRRTGPEVQAVFSECGRVAGFPFLVSRRAASKAQRVLANRDRSLQRLARTLKAKRLRVPASRKWELLNLNTPDDLTRARRLWRDRFFQRRSNPASAAGPVSRPGVG